MKQADLDRNEVLKMAKQAKQYAEYVTPQGMEWFDTYNEHFAKLVASAASAKAVEREREACAKIVENEAYQYASPVWAFEIVNAIKDRGEAT